MKKCEKIISHLSEYEDGYASDLIKKLIEQHLPTCEKCQEELRQLKKLSEIYKGHILAHAPDDFLEKVHKRIKRKKVESTWISESKKKNEIRKRSKPEYAGAGGSRYEYADAGYGERYLASSTRRCRKPHKKRAHKRQRVYKHR